MGQARLKLRSRQLNVPIAKAQVSTMIAALPAQSVGAEVWLQLLKVQLSSALNVKAQV